MRRLATGLFAILVLVVLFTTLAPLTHSNEWWIRAWDFPRVHIGIVAVLTALLGAAIYRRALALPLLLMVGCAIYQGARIFPYTPLAPMDIAMARDVAPERRITAIASNVLMQNRDHDSLRALIEREDPDILFLMETDAVWTDALRKTLARYDTVIEKPLDNHYGAIFATRLEADVARFAYLSDDETPTVLATLKGPTGAPFHFIGLHPRPPVPGEDTAHRDEQLRKAARLGDRNVAPVLAMGDFNDVAWSRNSQLFIAAGDYRDPRLGRGILSSFDARSWWMRFPIDQLYVTEGIDLVSFGMLEAVGSDHFPIKAIFAVAP
jgi:endonuclease/exonuclease/phosphatase (EEP) superfamily protein YafD